MRSARERSAVAMLAIAAAAHMAWNAWSLPAVVGYDAAGHAGYALSIAREGHLPAPFSGWSTFHPPAWYLAAAAAWRAAEPLGPGALRLALRALGGAAWLAAGLAVHAALRTRLAVRPATAWVALALFWFAPVCQLSVAMIGNEAFAAAWAAIATAALLRLESDPRDARAALLAGLTSGLAFASKFSGVWVVAACAVPFARRGLDRRSARALALCAASCAAIAAPVYARNLVLTGSPFPMTRDRSPMIRAAEGALTLGPRQLGDYVRLPASCLLRPTVHHLRRTPGDWANRNPAFRSVPCAVLAGLWYDPAGQRVPIARHRDGEWTGAALVSLGLLPTALVLLGGLAGLRDLARRHRPPETPLLAQTALGLASFVAFTWIVPSFTAAKASYLLPLAAPAAVFFARATDALPRRLRQASLVLCASAALASALAFANRLVFEPEAGHVRAETAVWEAIGGRLPRSHIDEAVRALTPAPEPPPA